MRTVSILLLVSVLPSCADTHSIKRSDASAAMLDPAGSAYVSMPMNGRYGQTVYADSGTITAVEVTRAFSAFLTITTQARYAQSKDEALEQARIEGYSYLVHPVIRHWEDRATEWSGLPDKISVEISVFDVATGELLDNARIDGKSKWATLGGDHPEDLLEKPLAEYARTLFP